MRAPVTVVLKWFPSNFQVIWPVNSHLDVWCAAVPQQHETERSPQLIAAVHPYVVPSVAGVLEHIHQLLQGKHLPLPHIRLCRPICRHDWCYLGHPVGSKIYQWKVLAAWTNHLLCSWVLIIHNKTKQHHINHYPRKRKRSFAECKPWSNTLNSAQSSPNLKENRSDWKGTGYLELCLDVRLSPHSVRLCFCYCAWSAYTCTPACRMHCNRAQSKESTKSIGMHNKLFRKFFHEHYRRYCLTMWSSHLCESHSSWVFLHSSHGLNNSTDHLQAWAWQSWEKLLKAE